MKDFICAGWFFNIFACTVNIFACYAGVADVSLPSLLLFHVTVFIGSIFYLLDQKEQQGSDDDEYYL